MLRLSAKQKREVYSVSNLLLHLAIFIILLITLNSCSKAQNVPTTNRGPLTKIGLVHKPVATPQPNQLLAWR